MDSEIPVRFEGLLGQFRILAGTPVASRFVVTPIISMEECDTENIKILSTPEVMNMASSQAFTDTAGQKRDMHMAVIKQLNMSYHLKTEIYFITSTLREIKEG